MATFHRTALAEQLAAKLVAKPATTASASGLFLAAPRRTGKSTFLREDLRPALEALGALVIYVDLWEDRRADPGEVIVAAIRAALAERDGVVKRLAKASGLEKVGVGGVSFALDRVGLGKGVSLSAALATLSDATRKLVVLVIDEAQHAITSDTGADALFALKAARDELNSSRHHGLRVVATGSNRDKLAMLRNSKDQAFYGAPLVPLPPLGRDYIAWLVAQQDFAADLDVDAVFDLFERAGHRPEVLGAALDALAFSLEPVTGKADRGRRLAEAVAEQNLAADDETRRVLHSLTPLQSAVLRVLVDSGSAYAPFEQATMQRYLEALAGDAAAGAARVDIEPTTANVQQALAALQDKALVWRAARGIYALEDPAVATLMRAEGMLRG
jgi:hypothetical protein